jgi:hypothetical protein
LQNALKKNRVTLQEAFPDVARQWHPSKNEGLSPDQIATKSGKMVWWKCPKGPDHEWQAPPINRTSAKTGCPFCSGKKVSVTNSLASLYPALKHEWHPTKNAKLTPETIVPGSNKRIWWRCTNGNHEWQAICASRTKGAGCPKCYRERVFIRNCLANRFPKLAQQWHPTKNIGISPESLSFRSSQTGVRPVGRTP